ncbi:MAG TPA: hypothetical protein VGO39_00555 [Gaiellaceae bacterium]|jgi:hypothetical protein|nr:hypothetical protein [Gaiellaceae bacterium]
MTELSPRLAQLGNALEAATAADLAGARRPRRRLALIAVAAAILIPGAAIAADRLISSPEVAASMPAGTLSLAGTEPTCTTVKDGVEFHCVLANAPAPEVSDWRGTVEPTVDATKHVNGGCRSLTSKGTEWECYIGQAAVDRQIIGQSLLGQVSSGPGVG